MRSMQSLLVPIPLVTASMATNTVSLKLLIDTKGHKVLFAEASKDFVDFLFTPLALPVGTVIRLLSKDNMVGSLGKLYDSLELLNDTYMLPNLNKDTLLKPKVPLVVLITAIAEGSSGGGGGGGYVKDVVTYMIMDNFEVKPMSTISCIAMLNRFNVKEVGTLEERMVLLGMDEGLKLLKASLESNAVLTNVFLGKKEE
ncbi:Protein of unknown function D [Prunus dulcis]|uniref:DUF674 family protein n=1 Tax=Prunus dulcis TaxID=3755 RepID=A0A4Y1R1G0_PRUDU|nr:Protein of unknown function D [Prunus dulcis]